MFSPQDIQTSNILQTNQIRVKYIFNIIKYNTMNGKRVHKFEVGQGGFGRKKWKREIFYLYYHLKKSIVQVT